MSVSESENYEEKGNSLLKIDKNASTESDILFFFWHIIGVFTNKKGTDVTKTVRKNLKKKGGKRKSSKEGHGSIVPFLTNPKCQGARRRTPQTQDEPI